MNRLLLTLSLPFVALAAHAADDLPPPRAAIQEAADDLPPPRRTSTRAPAAAEAAPPAAAADELPPPRRTARSRARSAQPTLKFGIDDLLAETGVLPDAAEADTYSTLRVSPYVQWQPSRDWEFRAGARLDGMS